MEGGWRGQGQTDVWRWQAQLHQLLDRGLHVLLVEVKPSAAPTHRRGQGEGRDTVWQSSPPPDEAAAVDHLEQHVFKGATLVHRHARRHVVLHALPHALQGRRRRQG